MKMDMSAKPESSDAGEMEPTNEGSYSQEEMAAMLDCLVQAKKIQDDPQLFAMIKDYAMSKHQEIGDIFPAEENKAPKKMKSFDDLRKKANSLSSK